jgi:hypothetical protein
MSDDVSEPVLHFLNANEAETVGIITLQTYLFDLTDSTFDATLDYLLTSSWVSDCNRIAELSQMLRSAITCRTRSVDVYVRLVVQLTRRATAQNRLSSLFRSLVSSLGFGNTASALFVLGLTENGLIDKSELARLVLNQAFNYFGFFWFAPEIEMFSPLSFARKRQEIEKASGVIRDRFVHLDEVRKDGWKLHLELRRAGCNPWPLAQLIAADDCAGCQGFMITNFIDVNADVPPTFYEQFAFPGIPETLPLLSYAALFGAVNCFRFLLLGGARIEAGCVGYCAIVGNNTEIVRLCEQRDALRWDAVSFRLAIQCHRFAIFSWMYEGCSELPLRSSEIITAALAAANFEVFAYNLLHATDFAEIEGGITNILVTAHRLKSFTAVRYLSSIIDTVRTASDRNPGELFSA